MITVVNAKTFHKTQDIDINTVYVYVGRKTSLDAARRLMVYPIANYSILGNPYSTGNRNKDIEDYKSYFRTTTEMIKASDTLLTIAKVRNIALICWCAPLACHGDVIKEWLDTKIKENVK